MKKEKEAGRHFQISVTVRASSKNSFSLGRSKVVVWITASIFKSDAKSCTQWIASISFPESNSADPTSSSGIMFTTDPSDGLTPHGNFFS